MPKRGYILDPHGAVAYRALDEYLQPGETGIFLETAHPAKFKETVDSKIDGSVKIPHDLRRSCAARSRRCGSTSSSRI